MNLPVEAPLKPMLAKAVKDMPTGDMLYEPKWDGFRCLVFRDGEEIGHRNYGLDGPAATDCNQLAAEEENGRPILAGDSFKSQSVFVV